MLMRNHLHKVELQFDTAIFNALYSFLFNGLQWRYNTDQSESAQQDIASLTPGHKTFGHYSHLQSIEGKQLEIFFDQRSPLSEIYHWIFSDWKPKIPSSKIPSVIVHFFRFLFYDILDGSPLLVYHGVYLRTRALS